MKTVRSLQWSGGATRLDDLLYTKLTAVAYKLYHTTNETSELYIKLHRSSFSRLGVLTAKLQQGCTNPARQIAVIVNPHYGSRFVSLAGALNFEMAPRFLKYLCIRALKLLTMIVYILYDGWMNEMKLYYRKCEMVEPSSQTHNRERLL